jgi:hypothetical protein
VRDMTQLTSHALADGLDEDFRPLWSPDGAFIVYASSSGLSRVAVASGAISPVCAVGEFAGGSGGTWTAEGRILFTKGVDNIYSVAAGGGVPAVFLARIDSTDADLHHPHCLPRDRGILCVRHLVLGGPTTLTLIANGKRRDLLQLTAGFIWEPVYDPRGYILYSRIGEGAGLWALPFSLDRLEVTGESFLIAPDGGSPSVAADGNLVYRIGAVSGEAQVVVVDRSGAVVDTLTEPRRSNWSLAPSPDETMLAVDVRASGEGDIWLHDLVRRAQTRFAFGPGRQQNPAWSPDGRELAWDEYGLDVIHAKPADGSQTPRPIAHGWAPQYTPDGQHLVYCRHTSATLDDIWYSSLGATADTVALVATPASETFPMPAPHGPYLLYVSDESGKQEVYLRQYPQGEARWQVSTSGGSKALWSHAGDRIYYWSGEDIYEVTIELKPAVRLGTPRLLFNLGSSELQGFGRLNFRPTARPDRFLAIRPVQKKAISPADVILVQNWGAEFKKK